MSKDCCNKNCNQGRNCPSRDEPMTLREIADNLGITPQSVAEILSKALKKVSKKLREKGIKKEDLL